MLLLVLCIWTEQSCSLKFSPHNQFMLKFAMTHSERCLDVVGDLGHVVMKIVARLHDVRIKLTGGVLLLAMWLAGFFL